MKSTTEQVAEQKVCKHDGAVVLYLNECPLCARENVKSELEAELAAQENVKNDLEVELAAANARISKLQSAPKESRKSKEELASYKKLVDKYVEENTELQARINAMEEAAGILQEFSTLFSRLMPLEKKPVSSENAPVLEELDENTASAEQPASPLKGSVDIPSSPQSELEQHEIEEDKEVQVVPIKSQSGFHSESHQKEFVEDEVTPTKTVPKPSEQSKAPKSSDESTGLPPSLEAAVQQYKAVSEKKSPFENLKNKLKSI